MKNLLISIGVFVFAIVVIAVILVGLSPLHAPPPIVSCTNEAMICPDGSAVGRTGPNCEFTQCPPTPPNSISIGENKTINGTTIRILELLEDSRCPNDVQCIQAGTVRVRATIDSYDKDFAFKLLEPQIVGDNSITLTSVIPAQKYSTQSVELGEYKFIFTVAQSKTSTANNTGVRGTVLLGPTCPVMRDPPDPECADKPYETTILVHQEGSNTVFATTNSSDDGTFEISLPAGKYTLTTSGASKFPRCSSMESSVTLGNYTTINISCDTGIR